MRNIRIFKAIMITLFFTVGTLPVMAQGAPPATPIDGGLSLLLVAGGAYGVRQLMKRNNHQKP